MLKVLVLNIRDLVISIPPTPPLHPFSHFAYFALIFHLLLLSRLEEYKIHACYSIT